MDRSIRVWNMGTMSAAGALTASVGGHTEGVTCLELLSLDEEYIASGGADTFVKLWSPKGELLWSDSQGAIVTALKSSQDKLGIVCHQCNSLSSLISHLSFSNIV